MRCLFLSNYYPPASLGGYELWCREVALELVRRGHEVAVLTSRSEAVIEPGSDAGVAVHRRLILEVEGGLASTIVRLLLHRRRAERESGVYLRHLLDDFAPDVALLWGMWNVPRAVPALTEELLPNRVAYYLCDYWPTLPSAYVQRWHEPSRRGATRRAKRTLAKMFLPGLEKEPRPRLRMEHPLCVSRALRARLAEQGLPTAQARVIAGGIEAERFRERRVEDGAADNRLKLVYLGRLAAEKGVHTLLEALALLVQQRRSPVTLDLFGTGDPGYSRDLKGIVTEHALHDIVTFRGAIDHREVPAALLGFDVLVFPSEWHEPFARVILEAMACSLAVIGTTHGGTGEVLIDGVTGLSFAAGDAAALADGIARLQEDPFLRRRLAEEASRRVRQDFTFSRMADEIETQLRRLAAEAGAHDAPVAVSS